MLQPTCTARRTTAAAALFLGALLPLQTSAQTSVVGRWSAPANWPLAASHAALMADGRVLAWNDTPGTIAQIWDPATGTFTAMPQISSNLVGSASALLGDGDVAILGGINAIGAGVQDAHYFDPSGPAWSSLYYMSQGRNEPTAVMLGDGRLLAISGERVAMQASDVPELCTPGGAWSSLSVAVLSLPKTPWTFWLSTGDVLVVGPDRSTRQLTLAGYGSWHNLTSMLASGREGGTAVLVPGAPDRILALGGRDPATPSCELLDLPVSTAWSYVAPMARARRHHQATLLADGSVLVTGGTLAGDDLEQSVYSAERYDPVANTWTTLASMSVSRRRDSVALLLPDARVLCTGGGDGTAGSELHANAEIFEPPYLFLGARPAVTAAPANVVYGSTFTVDTPAAGDIGDIWIVRHGSTTRGFNSDQRAVSLAFSSAPGRLTVTAPDSGLAAPPGRYLLFLVSDAGVPSLGQRVRVMTGVPTPVPPQISSAPPTATPVNVPYTYIPQASGTQPMTWSLITAPAWLGVSPTSGAVAGVPTVTGMYSVSLHAVNVGGETTQSWTIEVTSAVGVRTVIPIGDTWRYFKGNANPPSNWTARTFDDSGWLSGPSGFGFGDDDDATVLSDMQNNYTTVFTRTTFAVYNVNRVTKVSILYQYDDGLAVYLNGTRILAKNAPTTITNTSTATSSHEANLTLIRQDFTDATTRGLLVNGNNVLAAVGLNTSLSSNDVTLKVQLELTGGSDTPSDTGPESAAAARWLGVHPNPFTATGTRFALEMVRTAPVHLDIFDPAGRIVQRVAGGSLSPGAHALAWDGRDVHGTPVPPGVYFYRLQAPGLDCRGKLVRAR
jgi:hypothetical protein